MTKQKDLVERSTTTTTIPEDLVEEILCRVPTRSLRRLRLSSKRWNRLFKDDRRFARKQSEKAAKELLALMVTKDYMLCPMRVNLDGMIPSVEVNSELRLVDPRSSLDRFAISGVFHCDGLLLCTCSDESTFVIWNPCTGEVKWIRTGNLFKTGRDLVLRYCQDSKSCKKSYKILSRHISNGQVSIIYDFDYDSWRIVDDVTPGWSVAYTHIGVSLMGNTYWLASRDTGKDLSISLLKFDFLTEKSQPVPLPYDCPDYPALILSVVREEKLSVLLQRQNSSKTEIWVTNKMIGETKAVSWSKVMALDLSLDLQISHEGSFLLDEEKKVLVCCERWIDDDDETLSKDMVYIVGEDNKVTQVDFGVDYTNGSWPAILNYVPSLVQIGGTKRKRLTE